ncbi:MAG: cofactor-independent phosphoglycerate mutase [Anaerolineales bacterium]|nr:cofactor-independent phosphoglycerate mutase [Anaerolineales bacterium]
MANLQLLSELKKAAPTKIVLLVLDGLGGLPRESDGRTELEAAATPNMDRLAREGTLGMTIPLGAGLTPGSGPAHLSLFGYDPIARPVGRGVLESIGVGLEVRPGDVAARGNFCTIDAQGRITDRRAGRIPGDQAAPITERLAEIIVLRGPGLDPALVDTDPQATGVPPLPVRAAHPPAAKTAAIVQAWVDQAFERLRGEPLANGLTLRGFSTDPALPPFPKTFGVRAGCIAVYPMYRGVSALAGMQVVAFDGETAEDEFHAAAGAWNDYDFLFIHVKKPDSRGEDGDFEGKARAIEEVDQALPALLDLKPEVLAITGDHSTPSRLRSHSWHPVPLLLWAPATTRRDVQDHFGETACAAGGLGTFPASDLMPLLLAHAGRLEKYGA